MRKMKKALAAILTATMVMSMGMTAWASQITVGDTTHTDIDSVTIEKIYKLENAGTTSPAETFTVTQIGNGIVKDGAATSAPALGEITGAAFAQGAATTAGASGNITISLPEYNTVGVYEYTLKETVGNTAGVNYRSEEIKLVVTVMQGDDGKVRVAGVHTEREGGDKTGSIENIYKAAGVQSESTGLQITKTVDGNMGDKDKYFHFQVQLTGENDKVYADSYKIVGGSYGQNPETIAVDASQPTDLYLKHGEMVTIENLPYGVTYNVTEVDANQNGYKTESTNNSGTINDATYTAAFTNTKSGNVDTGIILDSMPYMVLLAVVILGMAAFVLRKRNEDLF